MRIGVVGSGRSVHVAGRSAALARAGHSLRLTTLGPALPVPGVEVSSQPLPAGPWAAVAAARRFLRDVRSFRPQVLHLHYAGGRLGTLATLTRVRPLAVTVMGSDVTPDHHPGGLGWLERRATRRILSSADLILAKSERLRDTVRALPGVRAPIEVVRWGVDPERFRHSSERAGQMRRRLDLADGDRIILSPRVLRPLYNVDLIVAALPAILARVPQARLLLTEYQADPAYRSALADRAAALGVGDRLRWLGTVEHGEMDALYSLADVVVCVPRADGLPKSLFEAMACEAPVVLGPLPGYKEVVADGETALLVQLAPKAIAAAVVRLEDAELRRSICEKARARVLEVASLPAEAARVLDLFSRLGPPRRSALGPALALDALSLLAR